MISRISLFQKLSRIFMGFERSPENLRRQFAVQEDARFPATTHLFVTGGADPFAYGGGCFGIRLVEQGGCFYLRNLDKKIDSIKQGSGNAFAVERDLHRRAGTLMIRIRGIAAWARVHGGNQIETRGESYGLLNARYCDGSILERLPEIFQHRSGEFRKFI